jgi:hypothetical protein
MIILLKISQYACDIQAILITKVKMYSIGPGIRLYLFNKPSAGAGAGLVVRNKLLSLGL